MKKPSKKLNKQKKGDPKSQTEETLKSQSSVCLVTNTLEIGRFHDVYSIMLISSNRSNVLRWF